MIGFMSDLHIDTNDFGDFEINTLKHLIHDSGIAHLHIAGDLSNDLKGISLPVVQELQTLLPVSFHLGNHDMLGLSEDTIQAYPPQLISFAHRQMIALAGWYDYGFSPEKDLRKNLAAKNLYWFDRKLTRVGSDPEITKRELHTLEQLLKAHPAVDLVALHFVPHPDLVVDHPYFHRFNGFLGSPAFHELFVRYGVRDVVYGHLHHRHKARKIDGVTYHSRPLGYSREWAMIDTFFRTHPEYEALNSYRQSKRYNAIKDDPVFQAFRKEHLYHEFQNALIQIPDTPPISNQKD